MVKTIRIIRMERVEENGKERERESCVCQDKLTLENAMSGRVEIRKEKSERSGVMKEARRRFSVSMND